MEVKEIRKSHKNVCAIGSNFGSDRSSVKQTFSIGTHFARPPRYTDAGKRCKLAGIGRIYWAPNLIDTLQIIQDAARSKNKVEKDKNQINEN